MVSTGTGIIVAVAIIAVVGAGLVFAAPGLFVESESASNQFNTIPGQTPTTTTQTSGTTRLGAGDKVEIESVHKDKLTNGALTEATNTVMTELGVGADGKLYLLSTGTDQVIELTQFDQGYVHVALEPASGQQYILARDELKIRNPGRIVDMQFTDWDSDGDKQWVVKVDTVGLKPQEVLQSVPILQIKVPWHNEANISLNSPVDQSSLGTSPVNVDIFHEGTGTSGDGTYFYEVRGNYNGTDLAEIDRGNSWICFDCNGPQERLLYLSEGSVIETSSSLSFRWLVGPTLDQAPYKEFEQNETTKMYFTTRLKLDLDTSDVRTWELEVYTWDPANSPNSTIAEDTVQLSA